MSKNETKTKHFQTKKLTYKKQLTFETLELIETKLNYKK